MSKTDFESGGPNLISKMNQQDESKKLIHQLRDTQEHGDSTARLSLLG